MHRNEKPHSTHSNNNVFENDYLITQAGMEKQNKKPRLNNNDEAHWLITPHECQSQLDKPRTQTQAGKYCIEIYGDLAEVNPFTYDCGSNLTFAQILIGTTLHGPQILIGATSHGQNEDFTYPFDSISTPNERTWQIHGNDPSTLIIAAELIIQSLNQILMDINEKYGASISQSVMISPPGPQIYSSVEQLESRNKQSELPHEIMREIFEYVPEKQSLAWDISMQWIKAEFDKNNIHGTNHPRNPYLALVYEKENRIYATVKQTVAYRARATMQREMIYHSTHPHIDRLQAYTWWKKTRFIDAIIGRTETHYSQIITMYNTPKWKETKYVPNWMKLYNFTPELIERLQDPNDEYFKKDDDTESWGDFQAFLNHLKNSSHGYNKETYFTKEEIEAMTCPYHYESSSI